MSDCSTGNGKPTRTRPVILLYLVAWVGGLIALAAPFTSIPYLTLFIVIGVAIAAGTAAVLLDFTNHYGVSWE